jgi:alkylated DNA nucleotide flippase Atl1
VTTSDSSPRIAELHLKTRRGLPMTPVDRLMLSDDGIEGDASPSGKNPRQITVVHADSLRTLGITGPGSRSNMVIDGRVPRLRSGALVRSGGAAVRITFACEPCAHGAKLAEVPMARFRGLARFLAVVVHSGPVEAGGPVTVDPGVFDSAPDDFRARTLWALDRIPPGSVVTSTEFLQAIGAGRTYARVLPRWMRLTGPGKPTHRVLRADLGTPSWCAGAEALLAEEGLKPAGYRNVVFPLTEKLWFPPLGAAS